MTRTTLKAQSDWLAMRKQQLGLVGDGYVLPNAGGRRTREKRSLLSTLRNVAAGNPRALRFKASL